MTITAEPGDGKGQRLERLAEHSLLGGASAVFESSSESAPADRRTCVSTLQ